MLDKQIPRSKKIGVIGLAVLVLLGAFLLPMARADKRDPVAIPETDTLSIVTENVAGTLDVLTHVENAEAASLELRPVEVEPVDAAGSSMSRYSALGYELAKSRSGIQKARVEIAKDMAEIEAIELQIKSLQQQIQIKLDMLHQKEAGLRQMQRQPGRNAKADDYVQTWPETSPPKRPMHSVHVGAAPQRTGTAWEPIQASPPKRPPMMGALSLRTEGGSEPSAAGRYRTRRRPVRTDADKGEEISLDPYVKRGRLTKAKPSQQTAGGSLPGAVRKSEMKKSTGLPQKNVSDEVRKELQKILPELLREILPKLLDEALAETAGNNDAFGEDGHPRGDH